MATRWCHNAKTGEIFSYTVSGGITDFPRGTFLAYRDYLTTGLRSKKEAEKWAKEWLPCTKCRSARKPNNEGRCDLCKTQLQQPVVTA